MVDNSFYGNYSYDYRSTGQHPATQPLFNNESPMLLTLLRGCSSGTNRAAWAWPVGARCLCRTQPPKMRTRANRVRRRRPRLETVTPVGIPAPTQARQRALSETGLYAGRFLITKEKDDMQDFTVFHIDHGSIVVDHVQATDANAALEKAEADGLVDPVVFAGHMVALA